jgi:Apea-like HEPN
MAWQIFPAMIPRAALVRRVEWPREVAPSPEAPNVDLPEALALEEVCLCLNLIEDCAPLPVARLYRAEEWVPLRNRLGYTEEIQYDAYGFQNVPIAAAEGEVASEIICRFGQLEADIRRKLHLPLARLGSAKRHFRPDDRALELVLGLEALLSIDEGQQDQISLAFRLRGAWLLGKDEDDRVALYEFFKKLYAVRSGIVHGRSVPKYVNLPGRAKVLIGQFLNGGIEHCSSGIQEIVRLGRIPNWTRLVLGRGP